MPLVYRYNKLFHLKMEYFELSNRVKLYRAQGLGRVAVPYVARMVELEGLIEEETTEELLRSCFRWKFLRYAYRPFTRRIVKKYYQIKGDYI